MFVVFIFNIQLHKEQGVNDKKKKKKKKKKIGTYILTWKDSDAKRTIYVGDIYTCISKDDNLIFFCCVGVLPFLRSRVSLSTIISYFEPNFASLMQEEIREVTLRPNQISIESVELNLYFSLMATLIV